MARLVPAACVKPFVKRWNNDGADATAAGPGRIGPDRTGRGNLSTAGEARP
jgi:hypothetical protein